VATLGDLLMGKNCSNCGHEEKTLEDEFKSLMEDVGSKIREALDTAKKLSEQHGIPFVDATGNPYFPPSFREKFAGIDESVVSDLTEIAEYLVADGLRGWQSSSANC
jgi:hypothetical protein